MLDRKNNFDFVRLVLSLIVVIVHLGALTQNTNIKVVSGYFDPKLAVDSFFIVSGFLIFMSYENSQSVKIYFHKRLRRIFPGYIFVILISSIILFFISNDNFQTYFNIDFIKYVIYNLLTLNFLHPTLPGVFENNHMSAVNGALWTIKVEIMFYFSVPFIIYFIKKINKLYILVFVYILAIVYYQVMLYLSLEYPFALKLSNQLPAQLAYFISGASLYYYHAIFKKYSLPLLTGALFILIYYKFSGSLYFLYPLSLSIVVIYIATVLKYLGNFGKLGDLSFGIYIWHFPIIQVLVSYNLFSNTLYGVSIVIISIFLASLISWHLIEKRFLYKSSHYLKADKS